MIELAVVTTEKRFRVRIAAVVLAAGGSTRMGQLKQLLPVGGQPMVRRVTEAVSATGLDQVVVVVGAEADAVEQALAGLPVDVLVNKAWAAGMSTSVQAGLGAMRPDIQAVLIVLADQPGLTARLLTALVARYQETGAPIVAPFYKGQRGNPVLFDRSIWPKLSAVKGDQGGRSLIARYQEYLERVEVDDPSVLSDIDTRQDYDELRIGNG